MRTTGADLAGGLFGNSDGSWGLWVSFAYEELLTPALVAGIAGCSSSPEPATTAARQGWRAASTDPKDPDAGTDGKAGDDCGPSGWARQHRTSGGSPCQT